MRVGSMLRMATSIKTIIFPALLLGSLWIFFSACGDRNDIEADITPQGNEAYHEQYEEAGGYENCFVCHPKVKLHLQSSNPYLDLDLIEEIIEQQGPESCRTCHYDNED